MATKTQTQVNKLRTLVLLNGALIENQAAPALEAEVLSGKQALVTAINSQGGSSTAQESLSELAQDVADLTVQQLDLTGITYTDGYTPTTVAEAVAFYNNLNEIDTTISDGYASVLAGGANTGFKSCRRIVLRGVVNINHQYFYNYYNSEYIELPDALNIFGYNFVMNCTNLKELRLPKLSAQLLNSAFIQFAANCTQLILIEIGGMQQSINFSSWNPTAVLSDATLTATLNENIRNHIAANIQDRTGQSSLTITFSQALRNALETATEQAFASKNWNISPARTN